MIRAERMEYTIKLPGGMQNYQKVSVCDRVKEPYQRLVCFRLAFLRTNAQISAGYIYRTSRRATFLLMTYIYRRYFALRRQV